MYRTLQWHALLLGFGAATVIASLVATLIWAGAAVMGRDALTGAVVFGVLVGLIGAGYVGGRLSMRKMFHGVLAALIFGFGVTLASLASGSPASPIRQAWFLVLAAGLGAVGAYVASRSN